MNRPFPYISTFRLGCAWLCLCLFLSEGLFLTGTATTAATTTTTTAHASIATTTKRATQQEEQEERRDYTFADLLPCTRTSLQLHQVAAHDNVEPCILADVQPNSSTFSSSSSSSSSSSCLVTTVQVTPVSCAPHRDGAITATAILNADNDGRGVAIGFAQQGNDNNNDNNHNTTYCQFRHVSVVAGNPVALGTAAYNQRHEQLLEDMVTRLNAQYIAGTCSFAAAVERESARRLQRMVLAQVGPPGFYNNNNNNNNANGDTSVAVNPYVFGIHINSDTYGIPAIQQLAFLPQGPETIPVRVIYRQESEFFYSTCQAILNAAQQFGFVNVEKVLYQHDADHDGDGTINEFDDDFLGLLADQVCPSKKKDHLENDNAFRPAIFACTLTEQDTLLAKWRANGCQPYAVWMTPSTWGWAEDNPDTIPYFQGGGQWHPAFTYGDKYFDSGMDFLEYNEGIVGYRGNYDMVVSYAMIVLFSQHLQSAYRIFDEPDPMADFATAEGYERLRRDMIILNVETIFGPVSFDEFQRNVGRGAAGTQWLPIVTNGTETDEFTNFLVSPFLQAERAAVAPGPVAVPCDAGSFDNVTRTMSEESLMLEKCSVCPVDTFTASSNLQFECDVCPGGTTTEFREGQTFCTTVQDEMVGVGLQVLGIFGVLCTWVFAIYFASWTIRNRTDPVVRIGQAEFLLTICFAVIVSSSSVIFLGFEAGSGEDETWADIGCKVAPFLYAAGWVTEYSSLSVKTYRLFRITSNQSFRRVNIQSYQMFIFVTVLLLVDMVLVTCMTIVTPLNYTREITNRDVGDNIVTIKTSGSCVADGNAWAFLGPVVALHACLQIGTNWLLFKVRGVNDRYQEQKYVALASLFVLEIIVVGVPVLVAVQDSPAARYIVMAAIVVFNDIGILCFVFLPKMHFRKAGLPMGVGVGESINRESMHRAINRRSQSFVLSTVGTRNGSRISGHRVNRGSNNTQPSEEATSSEKDEEEPTNNYSKDARPNSRYRYPTKKSNDSSGSWGNTGFKSSVADNLDSIMEVSSELRPEQESSKESGSESKDKLETSTEPILISEVQARVREKLAKRIAQIENKVPEGQTVFDMNTALSVGGAPALLDNLSDGSISNEFESEAGKSRLMNRLTGTTHG